uniref:Uncharacterized protein n=1 Tax=Panagrolaimus davidi TaxID=227884 RepID=A0A914PRH5_9BILA
MWPTSEVVSIPPHISSSSTELESKFPPEFLPPSQSSSKPSTPILPTDPITRWPSENEAFVEQARRVPIIRTVGHDTKLECGIKTPGTESEIKWDKIGSNMPFKFRIENGDLVIEDLRKEDEGLYQCSLTLPGKQNSVHFTDLKVADYVPVFYGSSFIDLPPLTDEEWKNLDLELSIKPAAKDGIILHTTKGVTESLGEYYHTVFLRKGKIVYRSKLGTKIDELESKTPVRVGKWSKIRILNNENEKTLIVNTDEPIVKAIAQTSEVTLSSIPSNKIHLGGEPASSSKFIGTISRIIINQHPVEIMPKLLVEIPAKGESGVLVKAKPAVEESNECSKNPCQNNGICIAANVHEGFKCECSDYYFGASCQYKDRFCANKGISSSELILKTEYLFGFEIP